MNFKSVQDGIFTKLVDCLTTVVTTVIHLNLIYHKPPCILSDTSKIQLGTAVR